MRAMYRVLRKLRLAKRIAQPGEMLVWDKSEEWVAKMVRVGAISKPRFPPLSELPGWEERGLELELGGIDGAEAFMLMDKEEVMRRLPELTLDVIEDYQSEIRQLLLP